MERSILISGDPKTSQTLEALKKIKKERSYYPKWVNEHTLLSVSIISFCTLLGLLGLSLWIVFLIAVVLFLIQSWVDISKSLQLTLKLDEGELSEAIFADMREME